MSITHRSYRVFTAVPERAVYAALLPLVAALIVAPAAWGTPLLVTGGDTLTLTEQDSPVETTGASIGAAPNQSTFATTSGTLIVEDGVEWANEGYFLVGSCLGFTCPNVTGTVEFMAGSTFTSIATGIFDSPSGTVRIGESGTGNVTLHADALWNHTGPSGQVTFMVGDRGTLDVHGELSIDSSTSVNGLVRVDGIGARLEVDSQRTLDVSGFGTVAPGTMEVLGGGFVEARMSEVAFGSNSHGHLRIADGAAIPFDDDDYYDDDDVEIQYSSFRAEFMDVGTFSGSAGTVTVENNARLDVDARMQLGRAGGSADLIVNEGGEVLVGGFFGGLFEFVDGSFVTSPSRLELYADGTVDLSGGGKVVIGTNTAPVSQPVGGTTSVFNDIDEGTLLVGAGGELRGSGLIIGDVLVDGGIVRPGNSIGELLVDGAFRLIGGELVMEIGSATAFDRLNVSGVLELGGTLSLAFIDGFSPEQGESFELDLFSAMAIEGMFSSVQSTGLAEGLLINLDTEALAAGQPVSFTVVPIPAAAWLFGSALLGIAALRRRMRN